MIRCLSWTESDWPPPQIGVSKRAAVVDIGDDTGRIELVNPEVIEESGEQTGPEGCLSFPDLYGEVKRSDYVKVKAFDRRGKPFTIEAEGFLARAAGARNRPFGRYFIHIKSNALL